ncbi:hypothetical protein [Pyxidicoccus xibeiensis]|uniref:hypothetical protein n=1 Tax=Pyxidicoccus xibeiensis TaxID=2906759 RepID=UPI0020A826A1|nr:hypothetical protein [Pyxidicoccus xibeiensis]MCP3137495.1 hypothetical protein [Pyxidicoccus xibeiensis]
MRTPSQRPTPSRRRRGAASVEMALTMIVFVPVFLYALFLDDLQRHSMDVQEAVVSTLWDFTGQDYSGTSTESIAARVQSPARLTYCDHEAGLDSFDPSTPECQEGRTDHHETVAVAGHVCWMHRGGEQITCEGPQRDVGALPEATYALYGDEHQRLGGMFVCRARAGVANYLLPEGFLQEFSRGTRLAKKNFKDVENGNVHKNAPEAGEDDTYYLATQYAALLTDSWALTSGDAVRPGTQQGPYYARVRTVFEYYPTFEPYRSVAELLQARFVQQQLLRPRAGDSLTAPHLAYSPVGTQRGSRSAEPTTQVVQEGRPTSYFSTPWRDWERDGHAKTYEARGAYYLGCQSPERC